MQIVKTRCDLNQIFFEVDKFNWSYEKNQTGLSLNIPLSKNPVTTPYLSHCKRRKSIRNA
jgi:hypothetical protein